MAKWAICVAKYRYDDAHGSATRSVISYFSNVKQRMTKRENNHDFIVLTLLLAPSDVWLCNQYVAWTKQCFLYFIQHHIWYPGAYCARFFNTLVILFKTQQTWLQPLITYTLQFACTIYLSILLLLFLSFLMLYLAFLSSFNHPGPPYEIFPVERDFFFLSECSLFLGSGSGSG